MERRNMGLQLLDSNGDWLTLIAYKGCTIAKLGELKKNAVFWRRNGGFGGRETKLRFADLSKQKKLKLSSEFITVDCSRQNF